MGLFSTRDLDLKAKFEECLPELSLVLVLYRVFEIREANADTEQRLQQNSVGSEF